MSAVGEQGTSGVDQGISVRDLALRCGDVHGKIMQLASELTKLSADELIQRGKTDLGKLHAQKMLTDTELAHLLDVLSAISADASPRERFNRVDDIRKQVEASTGSPYALVIATIAADSSRSLAERTEDAGPAVAFDAPTVIVVAADVVGGIGGVFVGDELCGVPCGVLGGAAGALGLSIAAQEVLQ